MDRVIGKQEILELRRTVGAYDAPVLSLYAHVNPAAPNNHPHAVAVRAKESMKTLGVPEALVHRVFERLKTQVTQARTLVLFADEARIDSLGLEVDLPVTDALTGHVEARWGAPYLTPLLLALDEYSPYGILFVDSDRWRLFEVFLGQIVEREQAHRPASPAEQDTLKTSQERYPAYVPVRGSAAKDNADWHRHEATRRFYEASLARIRAEIEQRDLSRLILLGPREYVHLFEGLLPGPLQDRVAARLPSLPSGDVSAHEVLEKVRPAMEAIEGEAEEALLVRVREEGHWGLERCLRELQQGQLYALVVPWTIDRDVYVDLVTGYVDTEPARLGPHNGQAQVETKRLHEVLPDLAMSFGARVEFVRGDRGDRLLCEFGGMGALPRW